MQNSTNRLFDKTVSAPAILRITRPAIAVALVEIDNPPANALTEELYAAINKAVVALERDMSTRAVIIEARLWPAPTSKQWRPTTSAALP